MRLTSIGGACLGGRSLSAHSESAPNTQSKSRSNLALGTWVTVPVAVPFSIALSFWIDLMYPKSVYLLIIPKRYHKLAVPIEH